MATGQAAVSRVQSERATPVAPLLAGARGMAPVLVALAPLALTVGATIEASPLDSGVGWAGGALVLGASAYITAIALLSAGAPGPAVVAAVAVLAARGVVYSAGLVSRMRGQPAWFRLVAPYFLVDPMYALVTSHTSEHDDPSRIRWYYLGAGLAMWVMWMPTLAVGMLLGPVLPGNVGLDFALPAMLIAFLVPGVRSWPAVVAAGVGGATALTFAGLPGGLDLLVAAGAGGAAALLVEGRTA